MNRLRHADEFVGFLVLLAIVVMVAAILQAGFLGRWFENTTGLEIAFTWRAVVIATGVMSFPLLVRTARVAFENVNPRLEHVARTLGAGAWRVGEIRATIQRKVIRAPFAGVLGLRQVNLGQYLNPGDAVVPLQSMDPVYVNFSLPQQDVAALRIGAEVNVAADSIAIGRATGRITAINSVVDEATRNVQVQATFQNPGGELRPGMFVDVQVVLGSSSRVIALPASAISYAPYGNSVFIVGDMKGPNGKTYRGVQQRFVKLGAGRGDQVSVVSGLKPGEEVVTSGVFKLRNGAAIFVNNARQPGNNPAPRPEDS